MNAKVPIETFPELSDLPFLRHAFTGRVSGVDVHADRDLALERLAQFHLQARQQIGLEEQTPVIFAEQVHGAEIAVVDANTASPVAQVDGLITATPGVGLGIYVADCCAIYLVDPERKAIGLLHSGRKGTDLSIVSLAIQRMATEFGCDPAQILVQLSPCIRPPHYEVDIAAAILRQCRAAGIIRLFDSGLCTASNPERYYSYRNERGKTGRMLALLATER